MKIKSKAKVEEEVIATEEVLTDDTEIVMPSDTKELELEMPTNFDDELLKDSTNRLKRATSLEANRFCLDEPYQVTNFSDNGKAIKLTLSMEDFTFVVAIKDCENTVFKQGGNKEWH